MSGKKRTDAHALWTPIIYTLHHVCSFVSFNSSFVHVHVSSGLFPKPCFQLQPPLMTGAWSSEAVVFAPHWSTVVCRPRLFHPDLTTFHSLELWFVPCVCMHHAHAAHKHDDPSWRLIPPHFLRPLLLSNWGGSEYNYSENHPGLMWGRINGIKKIICWPSGPSAVWGWEGNLKQREDEIVGF